MWHICRKLIQTYLDNNGYVSYKIAYNLIKSGIPKQIIEKRENPKQRRASYWSNGTISCLLKRSRYRKSMPHEAPGVYVRNMSNSQIDGDDKSAAHV
jgi:hypothetical protein